MLRYYHTAFHNIPNGVSVLDYGSRLSILPTISAASEIVLSDFSAVNRQALRDWLDNKEPPLFDWTDHFRYVVRELEGKGEEEVTRRQQEIRNVVKDVVHCDITQDPLIDVQYHKLYDVMSTAFVVEAVANSYEEYKHLLFRLTRLIKPGGHLLLCGVEDSQYYVIGDVKFRDIPLSSAMVVDAIRGCGFSDLKLNKVYPANMQRPCLFITALLRNSL